MQNVKDLVSKFGKTAASIKDILKTICFKEMELCNIKMEIHMWDNGQKTYFMVKENIHAKMVIIMMEDGFLEKNKDLVCKFGKMDKCTKDNSKKDIKMEKEK
jgi:hypothetical protein